jgi:hypothetical protein
MAAKNGLRKPAALNMADFVRGLPSSLPAKDVVAKAKEQGLAITQNYVYKVRSRGPGGALQARRRATAASISRASAPQHASAGPFPALAHARASGDGLQRQLGALVIEHGMRRVQQVLETIRASLQRSI